MTYLDGLDDNSTDNVKWRSITIARINGLLQEAQHDLIPLEKLLPLNDDILERCLEDAQQIADDSKVEREASARLEKQFQRVTFKAWDAMARDKRLRPVHRMTFLAILKECWSRTRAKIWESVLVRNVGCSKRTLTTTLANLKEWGWINIEHNDGEASTYIVLKPELIPPYVHTKKH